MASNRKPSLFAQRLLEEKSRRIENKDCVDNESIFGNKSNILSGPDAQSIHLENVQKLSSMTPEEIEYERNKLLREMDPAMVQLIQSLKPHQSDILRTQIGTANENTGKKLGEGSQCWKEPLSLKTLVNKGLHMDVVEHEKLKWMEDVPAPTKPSPGISYMARFSFNGDLLPYVEETPTEGLYHHGEEPERPGYTLQELMQLSRSSVLQQRLTAITTLGHILFKAGNYDCYLEKPLLSLVLDSELFLLLRFTMDDTVRSVSSAATTALSNLIVNNLDEVCLDRLLGVGQVGLHQPLLHVQIDIKTSEITELKDTELLKVDVVRGALRTLLLPRFRYIVAKMDPEPMETVCILKTLIRIARHSFESAIAIVTCRDLLLEVQNLLINSQKHPYAEAMKLFRILASHSQSLASQLMCDYSLADLIQKIIYSETRSSAKTLILECFFMWQTLLSYNLSHEALPSYVPVLHKLSQEHAGVTTIDSNKWDLEHASALYSTLALALRADFSVAASAVPAMCICSIKWMSQILSSQTIRWSTSKAVGAALHCIARNIDNLDLSLRKEITFKVQEFLKSNLLIQCFEKMGQYSWLLKSNSSSVIESLPCLGSVPSLVCDDSPYPFILGIASYLHCLSNSMMSEEFLKSSGIQSYFRQITQNLVQASVNQWYARLEINFLYTTLCLYSQLQGHLQTDGELVLQLALVVACCVHEDDRYMLTHLFEKIIFNPLFYSLDSLLLTAQLELMNLNGSENFLAEAIKNLPNISSCYSSILGLENLTKPYPLLTLTASYQGTETALPADWQFLPILRVYNCERQDEGSVQMIMHSLQWVFIMETLRHHTVTATCTAARYCRLACVFLAGTDLFRDVQPWLLVTLNALLKHNADLDFEGRIPGLTSVYDFYTQLVEQFVGVSYSDPVFGQYILIPLQQRHNVRFRKYIWTEQAAVLRLLSTPINQLAVPLKEFLEPLETDVHLVNVYLHALATGLVRENWSPVFYSIAMHHVSVYVKVNADQPAGQSLLQKIQKLGNKDLQALLLQYTYF